MSQSKVVWFFWIILYSDILINIDHGILPAATVSLKRDLGLENIQLGILGSMVFLGLTIGKS